MIMTSNARPLFTIGYEGRSLETVAENLRAAGVTTVLDVRDAPFSRKPGFSKAPLAATLHAHGIRYLHLPGLGNPKAGRDAAKAGDHAGYLAHLSKRLDSEAGRRDLTTAVATARKTGACLLCFEADAALCHRSIVAARIVEKTGQRIAHLTVPSSAEGNGEATAQLAFGFGDSV